MTDTHYRSVTEHHRATKADIVPVQAHTEQHRHTVRAEEC